MISPRVLSAIFLLAIFASTCKSVIEIQMDIDSILDNLPIEVQPYKNKLQIISKLMSSNDSTKSCSIKEFTVIEPRAKLPTNGQGDMFFVYRNDNKDIHFMAQSFPIGSLTQQTMDTLDKSFKVKSPFATKPVCLGIGEENVNEEPEITSKQSKNGKGMKSNSNGTKAAAKSTGSESKPATKKYLVVIMEYAIGDTLDNLLESRVRKLDTRTIAAQLLLAIEDQPEGLDYPRPNNIRIDINGKLQLANYILTSPIMPFNDDSDSKLVDYAAPEFITGHKVTKSVNVFALGAIVFRLLEGKTPFHIAPGVPSRIDQLAYSEIGKYVEGSIMHVRDEVRRWFYLITIAHSEKDRKKLDLNTLKCSKFFGKNAEEIKKFWQSIAAMNRPTDYKPAQPGNLPAAEKITPL
ncbi:protein kinase domain-containing protein [Ditylenchus destructor]|uniref:Protein kinase domain-containing protein n=1 Tax=Ditylenchus destructor TaxID=166010 RepID=A0AAD4MYZ0_9BILA|nr:protein kinase domain-containing protein [Ditylenchus destructor]